MRQTHKFGCTHIFQCHTLVSLSLALDAKSLATVHTLLLVGRTTSALDRRMRHERSRRQRRQRRTLQNARLVTDRDSRRR